MTSREHNRLVGIFLLAHGALQGLIMLIVGLIYGGIGAAILLGGKKGDQIVGIVFLVMIVFIIAISLLFLLPQLIAGFKMLKNRPNARTWGMIGSILACLSFPLGTAVGVYGLWFLFGDEGKKHYLSGSQPQFGPTNQPPPNSWR